MKFLRSLSMGALVLMSVSSANAASKFQDCPNSERGETQVDCPWAPTSRALDGVDPQDPSSLGLKLQELLPDFHAKMTADAPAVLESLPFWGQSLNFDEGVQATIVNPNLVDYFLSFFRAPARLDRVVHAGIEHTYGYLFSTVRTPYGYKRARWVDGDLEEGFGLDQGTFSPNVRDGNLLANVTYFAGSIAFRDEPETLQRLSQMSSVSQSLRWLQPSTLRSTRLEERAQFDDRTIVLRTDFVTFTHQQGKNAEVLIYSVKDFRGREFDEPPHGSGRMHINARARLITMFPVAAGFRNNALDPSRLGSSKPIQVRYNAFLPDLEGRKLEGSRTLTR